MAVCTLQVGFRNEERRSFALALLGCVVSLEFVDLILQNSCV